MLRKREQRFKWTKHTRKLKGFTRPQRTHTVLAADARPEHGIRQPMPPR